MIGPRYIETYPVICYDKIYEVMKKGLIRELGVWKAVLSTSLSSTCVVCLLPVHFGKHDRPSLFTSNSYIFISVKLLEMKL